MEDTRFLYHILIFRRLENKAPFEVFNYLTNYKWKLGSNSILSIGTIWQISTGIYNFILVTKRFSRRQGNTLRLLKWNNKLQVKIYERFSALDHHLIFKIICSIKYIYWRYPFMPFSMMWAYNLSQNNSI